MNIEEQFAELIRKQNNDDFISFLKVLSPEQKKLLAPEVKKVSKQLSEYGDIGGGRWGHIKGSDKQREMLQIASFVCLNRNDYDKSPTRWWFLREENLKQIIDWYVPDWFSDYINNLAVKEDFFSLQYEWLIYL